MLAGTCLSEPQLMLHFRTREHDAQRPHLHCLVLGALVAESDPRRGTRDGGVAGSRVFGGSLQR